MTTEPAVIVIVTVTVADVIRRDGDPPPDVVGEVGKRMGEAAHRLDGAESMRVLAMATVRAAELAAAEGIPLGEEGARMLRVAERLLES